METVNQSPNYKKINELASTLAKSEKYHGKGKGAEVKIGDFREILADLADEAIKEPSILQAIHRYGMERKAANRKKEAEERAAARKTAAKKTANK